MASNFKLFDEAKTNMMGDTEYATATQRLNGVQTGLASSKLNNKFAYQVSLMCYALAQIMQQNGQNALDTDTVSTFVSNLSNSILQKVADKAVYTDPMQGATSSVANRWISAGVLRAYIDSTFGGWYDSSGNFIMQVNKGGTGLNHVPVGALMVGNNTGPFNFLEIGASVPGVMVRQPTVSMASPIYYDFHYNSGPGYYCGFTIIQWRPDLNQPIVDWLPISKDTSTEAVPFYNRSNNQLSWIVPPSSGKWSLGFLGNSIAQFAEPYNWNPKILDLNFSVSGTMPEGQIVTRTGYYTTINGDLIPQNTICMTFLFTVVFQMSNEGATGSLGDVFRIYFTLGNNASTTSTSGDLIFDFVSPTLPLNGKTAYIKKEYNITGWGSSEDIPHLFMSGGLATKLNVVWNKYLANNNLKFSFVPSGRSYSGLAYTLNVNVKMFVQTM